MVDGEQFQGSEGVGISIGPRGPIAAFKHDVGLNWPRFVPNCRGATIGTQSTDRRNSRVAGEFTVVYCILVRNGAHGQRVPCLRWIVDALGAVHGRIVVLIALLDVPGRQDHKASFRVLGARGQTVNGRRPGGRTATLAILLRSQC